MKESYNRYIDTMLTRYEGYQSNDPADPGKLTIWGIASAYHPREVAKMQAMGKQESFLYAKGWYRRNYWEMAGCDDLTYPLDIIVFDTAVNLGVTQAREFAASPGDWKDVLLQRIGLYCQKVAQTPAKGKFLRGWVNRCLALWETCKS